MAGRLFVGGDFPSAGGSAREGLAAFDLATGRLLPWAPQVEFGPFWTGVYALAADGDTLYFGGAFSKVNGTPRPSIAAVDSSGALLPWNPKVTKRTGAFPYVNSLQVSGGVVYAGGNFVHQQGGAGIEPSVNALALSADGKTLYLGGRFATVDAHPRNAVAAANAGTGQLLSWNPTTGPVVVRALASGGASVFVGGEGTVPGIFKVDALTGEALGLPQSSGRTRGLVFEGTSLFAVEMGDGSNPVRPPPYLRLDNP